MFGDFQEGRRYPTELEIYCVVKLIVPLYVCTSTYMQTVLLFKILLNIPVEGIRLLDAMCLLLGTPVGAVWSQPGVVCSEKVMFDPLTR